MFQYHYGWFTQWRSFKKFSFASLEPSKKELLEFVFSEMNGQGLEFDLGFGLAITNPKDRFVRQVGRKLALDRIKKRRCKLLCIHKLDITTSNVTLISNFEDKYNVIITFRVSSKSDRIRIEEVALSKIQGEQNV